MIRSRPRTDLLVLAGAAALLVAACSDEESSSSSGGTTTTTVVPQACVPNDGPLPHEHLTEYCFFQGDLEDLVPADGTYEYDVAAALWSDHAAKQRLIALPKGKTITFDAGENWQFPLGTILVKTFSFYDDFRDLTTPHHILETRLLILGDDGWKGHVYRWNDEQTEATLLVAGQRVDVSYIDETGEKYDEQYIVPNTNQCKSCHERDDEITFLGPFTHQLNRPVVRAGKEVSQLDDMAQKGMFGAEIPAAASLPAFPDPFGDAPLDDRARAYLHANCSHCHRPGGVGGPSGLVLLAWENGAAKNGVCKEPAAAGAGTGGLDYDILPGDPEHSILIYRVSSTDPQIKMPELPNRIVDKKGVALLTEWIAAMDPATTCE